MSQQAPFVDAAVSVDPTNRSITFASYYPYGAVVALGLDLTLRSRFAGKTLDDFNPANYFHSIRQWAIWSEERGLDRQGFEKAFLERTKKNFKAARQNWNKKVENVVRQLAPNRFKDVTQILNHARQARE